MPSNSEQFAEPVRFVVRETELPETKQLLKDLGCRLLTLWRVGGIGKRDWQCSLPKLNDLCLGMGFTFPFLSPFFRVETTSLSALYTIVEFQSANEGEQQVRAAYADARFERQAQLKRKYDPQNLFRVNQNTRPGR